jgi:serine/threonine-protein kinase
VRWLDRAERENQEVAVYRSDLPVTPDTVGCIWPCHSPAGMACLEALVANSTGDVYLRAAATNRLLQLSNDACDTIDIKNGSPNTLLALSLLVDAVRWDAGSPLNPLVEAGNRWFASIRQQCDAMPGIADSEPDTCLGMGRGWASYLYATLRWMQSAQLPAPANLETRLEQLADQARWDSSCASWRSQARRDSAELGDWCSGSAGYVFLWCLAHRLLRDSRWLRLAEAAGADVCNRRAETWDLCCGLAGQAYSQLHLYKHTGDRMWLENASALTARALRQAQLSSNAEGIPGSLSLCKGRSALAILISDLSRPECSAMPFFEDEGWPASLG